MSQGTRNPATAPALMVPFTGFINGPPF